MPRVLIAKATPAVAAAGGGGGGGSSAAGGGTAAWTTASVGGKEVQLKLEPVSSVQTLTTAKRVLVSAPTTPTYNGRTPLIVTPSSSGGAGSVGKQATFTIIKQDGTTATATPASLPPNTRYTTYY